MITFIITKDNISHEFICSFEDSILSLKKNIIKKFSVTCENIDIDFKLERPIRSLGKFNLESGILPRSLDNYSFDRYGLDGKTIHGTYHEINDNDNDHKRYKPIKHKPMFSFLDNEFQKETNGFNLDITSDVDFPKLGNQGMGRGKVK